jgi:hypothetical protein
MPIIRKVLWGVAAATLLGPVVLIWREPWQPMDAGTITANVAALMHYGAIDVPHDMAGPGHPEAALMQRVGAGETLSTAESARYRMAIQGVLADHQTLFRLLDNNLIFATDVAMNDPNNCGGFGIAGRHDLHAASAASNFAELEASLAALNTAGWLGRIRHANRAYKSLTDLMVHLAPAQASVMQAHHPALPDNANAMRAAQFTLFRKAMTNAGFAKVNSAEQRQALEDARMAFSALATAVQAAVITQLSPMQQRLAGRWLAVQSLSPRLNPEMQ